METKHMISRHYSDITPNFSPSYITYKLFGVIVHRIWVDMDRYRMIGNYKQIHDVDEELAYIYENTFYKNDLQVLLNRYPDRKYDIFMGIISCFNFDDIDYYCMYEDYKKRPKIVSVNQWLIENKLKFEFGWVLSPKTIRKVARLTYKPIEYTGSWDYKSKQEIRQYEKFISK